MINPLETKFMKWKKKSYRTKIYENYVRIREI